MGYPAVSQGETGGCQLRQELRARQLRKALVQRHQLVEGAALHQAATVEHQDARGVAHGGQPMGDREAGAGARIAE